MEDGNACGTYSVVKSPQVCHCEGALRPWQSREGSYDFADRFPTKGRVLRDCTPRALPRASRLGRHVGLWPPRNDKSGSWSARRKCSKTCNCQWRSLTAATGAIGAYHFPVSLRRLPAQRHRTHRSARIRLRCSAPAHRAAGRCAFRRAGGRSGCSARSLFGRPPAGSGRPPG